MQQSHKTPWHTLDEQATLGRLRSSRNGLSPADVEARLARFGQNSLGEAKGKHPLMVLLDQFRDFMIGILLAAAIISGFIGELKDTAIILVIVLLNAVIGFVQEFRSERAMEALRGLSAPRATVVRQGKPATVDAASLVPGDIVTVEAGGIVPADLRLLEVAGLTINESTLTGESVPAEKTSAVVSDEQAVLADRLNLAFAGTIVTASHGTGVVVATGAASQLGQIAGLVDGGDSKTPLQRRLTRFGRILALTVVGISTVVFVTGVVRGEDPSLMLLTAISLAVAAIPEALPAVVTISLALGAQQLVKKHALVRRLPAVETLGSVTYICSDKTGTLTKNEMTVTELFIEHDRWSVESNKAGLRLVGEEGQSFKADKQSLSLMLAGLAGCNNAVVNVDDNGQFSAAGEPTEGALALFASEGMRSGWLGGDERSREGVELLHLARLDEIPFDSRRKRMTTIHEVSSEFRHDVALGAYPYLSFTKGAFDVLFPRITSAWADNKSVALDDADAARIENTAEAMASDGLRVLALTCRFWGHPPVTDVDMLESNLVLVGLVGIMDPPRKEVLDAVKMSRAAGITPVMITGDHPSTARRIAQDLGISGPERRVVTGAELEAMTLTELKAIVEDVRVYARVAPEHKIMIVRALQELGELVAMTGDGVNDAPALKAADIGVAMGKTGTDVAKESSDLVLLDDNFATIVGAVAGGRRIYDNIRRFIQYTLTSNSAELLVMFVAPFAGLPLPLLPIHILWINLVTDGLPGLALATEAPESRLMIRGPRHPKESVLARGMWQHIIWVGILMAGVSLFSQAWFIGRDGAWQTAVFSVLALSQMGHALAVRSETDSLFRQGLFSNRFLVFSVALTLILQLLIIYAPPLQDIFRTEALTLRELALVLALSSIVFCAVEIEKTIKRLGLRRPSSV